MLLDNPCCMRVGRLLGGLNGESRMETTTHKRGSVIILIAIFPIGIMYDVNSNKQIALIKKVAILTLGGMQTLRSNLCNWSIYV